MKRILLDSIKCHLIPHTPRIRLPKRCMIPEIPIPICECIQEDDLKEQANPYSHEQDRYNDNLSHDNSIVERLECCS